MNLLYKFVLTLNATSWVIVIYAIKEKWQQFGISIILIGAMMFLIPIILSLWSLHIAKQLGDDSLSGCREISLADNAFIPTYLGYFFVSLSVPDNITMIFMYLIIFVFTWLSQTQYFNPLYMLFGYHYYHVTTVQGTKIFVIAHGSVIRNREDMKFEKIKRVNDTTYLAVKEVK